MAKVSANSPESMFSDESKVFRVLVYKPCTRYFVSQSIIRGNKTADKDDGGILESVQTLDVHAKVLKRCSVCYYFEK